MVKSKGAPGKKPGKAGTGAGPGSSCSSTCGEMKLMCVFVFIGVLLILLIETLNLGIVVWFNGDNASLDFVTRLVGLRNINAPEVKATKLRGRAAAMYKKQVRCFSESGTWVFNDTPRWIPPNTFGDAHMGTCDRRWLNSTPGGVVGEEANQAAANGSDWNVRPDLKWLWETNSSCPVRPFDRADFCRVMGAKGNLMLVGDSLNQELFYVLLNALVTNTSGLPVRLPLRNWEAFSLRFKVCEDVLGEAAAFHIAYVRNDRLSLTHKWEKCMRESSGFQEFPWISYLAEWNVSVLVLNRGAHYETNGNYTEHLINTLHLIQARYPNTVVIYRSTPHGHPNCSEHNAPMTKPVPPEVMPYNWAHFAEQNLLAEEIVERFRHTFLDFAAILNKRPDGHVGGTDCLHYCLPGPMDAFLPLFYNVIRLLP